jgi:acyl-CoA thioesterase YciA
MRNNTNEPVGELALRIEADESTISNGSDALRGWLLAQMETAARMTSGARARGPVKTASVLNLDIKGLPEAWDVICVYAHISRVGRTSITVAVSVYALRSFMEIRVNMASADYVVVALDDRGLPRMVSSRLK